MQISMKMLKTTEISRTIFQFMWILKTIWALKNAQQIETKTQEQ